MAGTPLQPEVLATVMADRLTQAMAPMQVRVQALDAALMAALDRVRELETVGATLRERLAVLETRAPVPGPPGVDGAPGRDGQDGVGFDDLSAEFDGDRTLTLQFVRGTVTKMFPLILPIPRYLGVFSSAQTYRVGDLVTWAGSMWACQLPTSAKPDDHSAAWRLVVKKGRDGRDGRLEAH